MSEEYSTQIEDLPDEVSDIILDDNEEIIVPRKNKTNDESLIMDSSVLFMILMIVTNKSFIKFVSQYNTKGHIVLSLILSLVSVTCFIIYKLLLLI